MLGVLWPFHVEDVRRFQFELMPARQVNASEVEARAEELRARVRQLPAPSVPDDNLNVSPGEPSPVRPELLRPRN